MKCRSRRINTGPDHLAVKEVGGHEELQRDLGRDGELGDLGGAVGEADLVREIHADLLQHVRRDLAEVDLVSLVLGELSRAGQHRLDGPRGQSIFSLHYELMPVAGDEFDKPDQHNEDVKTEVDLSHQIKQHVY